MVETVHVGNGADCRALLERFLQGLAEKIREAIAGTGRPPLLKEVLDYAKNFIETHGGCSSDKPLLEEFQAIAKLALDYSMEALSKHMEAISEETYSVLSGALTAYAVHIARLVAVVIDEASRLGGLSDFFLEAAEPLIFAAAARQLALAILIRSMATRELEENVEKIKQVIDLFIGEDNSYLKALYASLYGWGE
jgi:hypothetical protein